ncbi:uncharacterized protein PADG_12386 [Paracoccidioides brasiliensis Pb18]|uniref:Uncharacterized protein n=1 Tax=Paracoccidioides brasiliensis (strain Pb18) TaxID=502780 RepID=A0A0A0HT93_PARBD|nr:uncharacterized protein PADG_12386 [Paracoccidioides brasiliensis Pb18]KGM91528.1 hypothetical protein PADG_12386 [Paracoccidioides brasiliensis Pb18]
MEGVILKERAHVSSDAWMPELWKVCGRAQSSGDNLLSNCLLRAASLLQSTEKRSVKELGNKVAYMGSFLAASIIIFSPYHWQAFANRLSDASEMILIAR